MKQTPHQLVCEFRNALLALLPVLLRVGALETDTQPYTDEFDSISEPLWESVVARTLGYESGLERTLAMSRYGFVTESEKVEAEILVSTRIGVAGRFVQFIGDRTFGEEPFNAVSVRSPSGQALVISFSSVVSFTLASVLAPQ